MKVLLVSSSSGSRGGGEIYLQRLALGLTDLGHDVHLLCSDDAGMDELVGRAAGCATVHRLCLVNTYERPTRLLGAVLDRAQRTRAADFFKDLSPDLVHVNQQVAEDGLDLLLAAEQSGIPFVSTIHISRAAQDLGARFGWLRDRIAKTVLKRIDGTVIVVADHAARELRGRLGVGMAENRVRVVRNGVCESPADRGEMVRSEVREAWGAGAAEIVFGCVGRLEAQKNPMFLLDVTAALREQGVPARLVWIGDGPFRRDFLEKAATSGLGQAVTVDGWRDDAMQRMYGLDVFVLASRFEGLPLALLESMAVGLPSCVSDVDGMPEAVEHGVSGYVCALDDLEAWTACLLQIAEDPALRRRMGERARELARARFSIRRMAEETAAVYEAALADRSVPSGAGVT